MHSFEVHSNESACRKKVRLGLEQVITSSSGMFKGTNSWSSSYSSKEEHSGSARSGVRIAGCLYLRTSMTGRPVLESVSTGNNTPICPCPMIILTAARILLLTNFELKVLASVYSFPRIVLVGQDRISTTVSKQRATCFPIYHIYRLHVIQRKI